MVELAQIVLANLVPDLVMERRCDFNARCWVAIQHKQHHRRVGDFPALAVCNFAYLVRPCRDLLRLLQNENDEWDHETIIQPNPA